MGKLTTTIISLLVFTLACGKKSDSNSSSTDSLIVTLSDNFPSFYKLASETAPAVTSSSSLEIPLALASFSSDYESTPSEFLTAFSVDENYIGQVLNDAGPSGPVKSIYVLLAQLQSTLDQINSMTAEEEGSSLRLKESDDEPTCTKTSVDEITTPFFSEATNDIFNKWVEKGKYSCVGNDVDDGIFVFGSAAIKDPPSGCDAKDAYEFYVMEGSATNDQTNTEQVATRGNKVDGAGIKKFYYNGCTGKLHMAYAQSTRYSLGVEFSSRTELSGNSKDKSFTMRSNFIDSDTNYATHNTFVGHGKSRKASAKDSAAYFIMGYRSDNCGTAADSTDCTLGTTKTFCVKNSGTGNDLALAEDTSDCQDYESTYEDIDVLIRSDLPKGYFKVSKSEVGL